MMLTPDDFAAFFDEVHDHGPFPWQERLLRQIVEQKGKWPSVLDLPTGTGKTAAIDISVFHLALEADRAEFRCAPVRIAFVVDRRLVVDDAYTRATKIQNALATAQAGSVAARVAERLRKFSHDGPPLIARRLRGGIPREGDWARTPTQPTVLCSTVDQIGSRLLFRGYGVSDSMKPVHAGLLGSDCLLLIDEAHLAEPFRQTLEWVRMYQGNNWRESSAHTAPGGVVLLTATPGGQSHNSFSLQDDDKAHPILKRRLTAAKPARLVPPDKAGRSDEDKSGGKEEAKSGKDLEYRIDRIVDEILTAYHHFKKPESGAVHPAIGVVVNRVSRARAIHKRLTDELKEEIEAGRLEAPSLMIGPARPLDRDELAKTLEPIRTRTWKQGEARALGKSILLVATQCIEVGVDIDLDGIVTEAAPLDALRQRFGRLNRAGRNIKPYAAIIATRSDVSMRQHDPVYGKAIKPAWDYLNQAARSNNGHVDFGIDAMQTLMAETPPPGDALTPKVDAPVLLPAHLDLLSQTAPIPAADPDISLYLHGPDRQPDAVTVVWRADIDPSEHRHDDDTRRLLVLAPPRSTEAIELPVWAVRGWLANADTALFERLADVAVNSSEEEAEAPVVREVFRWRGDEKESRWITPSEIRPGDVIVVPARYGGLDRFGWNPDARNSVYEIDIGRQAAEPFAGRRFVVRVAPGLLRQYVSEDALADALASAASGGWQDVRDALFGLSLPDDLRDDLGKLDHARKKQKVFVDLELYGRSDHRPRGVVFVAPFGIRGDIPSTDHDGQPNTTEDDTAGSMPGFPLTLAVHSLDVEEKAKLFATAAGLPAARVNDLKLAGFLHDLGKSDARFQAWLRYGDPLGSDPDEPEEILAKSGCVLPRAAREASGLPANWRHEACSVRLALAQDRVAEADDPELVLWLIGVHHGYGRPLFPHRDPTEKPGHVGPQSLAFDWRGLDWATLFARLKARYGVWELARMEAILRLADHRASEDRTKEASA